MKIDRIVDICSRESFLIVLDGLETQQDSDGYIDVRSLPMDTLITRLAATKKCKVLITTRVRLRLVENIAVKELGVGFLTREEVQEILLAGVPNLDRDRAMTIQGMFFSKDTIPLTVAVFVDMLNLQDDHALEQLLEKVLYEGTQDLRPLRDICQSLLELLPSDVLVILGAVAVSDIALSQTSVQRLVQFSNDRVTTALDHVSQLKTAIGARGGFDLHPLVREAIVQILEEGNPDLAREMRRGIAREAEATAAGLTGQQRLSHLYRSLSFWLRSGDLQHAIFDVYIRQISGEAADWAPPKPPRWRSVREDFAYRFEVNALDEITTAIEKTPGHKLGYLLQQAAYRKVLALRAMGLIEESDNAGAGLASTEIKEKKIDTGTTGQIALTQLIRGDIKGHAAREWCRRTQDLASAVSNKTGELFPLVRAKVYLGAYYHRLGLFNEARAAFNSALGHQTNMHEKDPSQPAGLIGLPAYLYVWFLIESKDVQKAVDVVADCRSFLESTKTEGATDPTLEQWSVMTDITETWVAQEYALILSPGKRAEALKYLHRAKNLLETLSVRDSREFSIPFDLGVTYVRARARQNAMEKEPAHALGLLRRNVSLYERRKAGLFAADCQADIVRIMISREFLDSRGWTPPTGVELQEELVRLTKLSKGYPLGTEQCFNMPRLKSFDL